MKIVVVNVNTSQRMTDVIEEAARRHASTGTEIVALTPFFGAEAVDCSFESYLAAVAVMDRIVTYEESYDAVVMAGFGEYGRNGIQELIEQPVFEICEASAHIAMMIGRTYSVITTLRRSVPAIEDCLHLAGLWDRCASVRAAGISTAQVDRDPAGSIGAIVDEARRALEVDKAEVICLGLRGYGRAAGSDHLAAVCTGHRWRRCCRPSCRGSYWARCSYEQGFHVRHS